MKAFTLLLFGLLPAIVFSQPNISTAGDKSPAAVAQNFSAVYGVRADAIQAILRLYEKDEPNAKKRNARVERLIRQYSLAPERKKGAAALGDDTKAKLGLNTNPAVASALDWDLFATQHYLSTAGANSPAVVAGGDVNIWYGIPPAAVRALAEVLEKNKTSIADLDGRLQQQVKKYEELKAELVAFGSDDPIIKKVEQLLDAGKLYEVEQFLDNYLEFQDKRLAYRHSFKGGLSQIDTAATHYRKALALDPDNFEYLLINGDIEFNLGHNLEAIGYYQKALENAETANNVSFSATCFNNIGKCNKMLGNYAEGLNALEIGIARAESFDKQSGKTDNAAIIQRMHYHKIGCLLGLGRKEEADVLVAKVREEAFAAKDNQTLDDLKKDGWIKE